MVDFKLVFSTKDGKSVQKEVSGSEAASLVGKPIGEVIKGELIGLAGYELQITGGSDYCGFPMRRDIPGSGRKRILAVKGVGVRKKAKGIRQRKTVCGNTIHPRISQINLKVLKEGKAPLAAGKEKEQTDAKEEAKEKPSKGEKEEKEPSGEKEKPSKKEKEDEKESAEEKKQGAEEKPAKEGKEGN